MFFLILPLFFLLPFNNVFSIDVIKIGIVDFDRVVIEVLNPQLKANLDQIKNRYQEQINTLNLDLKNLRQMYDKSIADNDLDNARSFGNQYNLKVDELKRISSLAKNNLEQQRLANINSFNNNSEALSKILHGIQYVAEVNGFSLIMKKDNPYILYYNSTVDVTDNVIKYLLEKDNKNP
ncbi:OmpH family outer membrane protein [Borreliella lusitaniae]|uniref:OmpH family outer membrane protein n=1 Tax=Borreliella lusitaniae TaxID=100177 RepID=UPI00292DC68D|nr:OmpH family outer membrane protein [Borreliella lusitaniae]WNY67120.1 OmpH family outer membrane protein [Borreliella lusitaniae]